MDRLHVATVNVWGLPWPLSRQRGRRFARLARWLGEDPFDVVGLQAGQRHAAVRRVQVDELLALLTPGPTVLMGDFNFYDGADEAADRALHDAGFVDVGARQGHATFLRRNPFARAREPRRFDRIYVRDGSQARWRVDEVEVVPRVVSDHQPVRASLRLESVVPERGGA